MRHHNSQAPTEARLSLRLIFSLVFVFTIGFGPSLHAQWSTHTVQLKPGWNSVFIPLDTSHTNINGLVRSIDPIDEVWLWNSDLPPSLIVASPPDPTANPSQWSKWTKVAGPNPTNTLDKLPPNA